MSLIAGCIMFSCFVFKIILFRFQVLFQDQLRRWCRACSQPGGDWRFGNLTSLGGQSTRHCQTGRLREAESITPCLVCVIQIIDIFVRALIFCNQLETAGLFSHFLLFKLRPFFLFQFFFMHRVVVVPLLQSLKWYKYRLCPSFFIFFFLNFLFEPIPSSDGVQNTILCVVDM